MGLPLTSEDPAMRRWCRQEYKVGNEISFVPEGFPVVLGGMWLEVGWDDTRDEGTKRHRMALS